MPTSLSSIEDTRWLGFFEVIDLPLRAIPSVVGGFELLTTLSLTSRNRCMNTSAQQKAIDDFGCQWTHYTSNSGFYGSQELFRDILSRSYRCSTSEESELPKSELGQAEYPPRFAKPAPLRLPH